MMPRLPSSVIAMPRQASDVMQVLRESAGNAAEESELREVTRQVEAAMTGALDCDFRPTFLLQGFEGIHTALSGPDDGRV